jgi:CHAT domain-containing protein
LSVIKGFGDQTGELLVLGDIAALKRDQGHIDEAMEAINRAIQMGESQRVGLLSDEHRADLSALLHGHHEILIDLLMRKHEQNSAAGNDVAAFEASEFGRARTLSEMLGEARANQREGAPADLVEEEERLSIVISNKAARQLHLRQKRFELINNGNRRGEAAREIDENAGELETLTREIDELSSQLDRVTAQINALTSKRHAALFQPQRTSLKRLQSLLDPDTLVLEYSLGETRSYVWAVSANSIESYTLPKAAQIERQAALFYRALSSSPYGKGAASREKTLADARARLGSMLVGPVAAALPNKRLVIVPDAALHYIPFAALRKPGSNNSLIVDHEIVELPSLSVLAELRDEMSRRPAASKILAAIADPVVEEDDFRFRTNKPTGSRGGASRSRAGSERTARTDSIFDAARSPLIGSVERETINLTRLPSTREEADALKALVPESDRLVLTGFDANRIIVLSGELSRYRIVHFATHGLIDFRHPRLSCLLLSRFDPAGRLQDDSLRLQDIFKMRLSADLVVLSACQTALGKEVRGEGLVGLTRGFMYAGAPRVVASLWNIDDRASAKLMERFYPKMLGPEHLRPAAALRAAQIEMMRDNNWSDPFFWAGFVLQGEWK